MGDEIKNCNVVRITRDGDRWCALIGPDAQSGLIGFGRNPASALVALAAQCLAYGWCFDPTWKPGRTTLHDA